MGGRSVTSCLVIRVGKTVVGGRRGGGGDAEGDVFFCCFAKQKEGARKEEKKNSAVFFSLHPPLATRVFPPSSPPRNDANESADDLSLRCARRGGL